MRFPLACALAFILACGGDDSPEDPSKPDASVVGRQTAEPDEPGPSDVADVDAGGPVATSPADAAAIEQDAEPAAVDAAREPTLAEAARRLDPESRNHAFFQDALSTCEGCHVQQPYGSQTANVPFLEEKWAPALYLEPRRISSCKSLPYITDGHPEQSYLYLALTDKSPCKSPHGASPEVLAKLADWITVAPWSAGIALTSGHLLRAYDTLNVVFDGNSLIAGAGASVSMPAQVAAMAPLAGTGATVTNVGISGQTWQRMNGLNGGSSGDVDSAWVAGRYNVLVLWESTNSIHFGATAEECQAYAAEYIAARKAIHPWRVVLLTTLPRSEPGTSGLNTDAVNREWDGLIAATYRDIGVDLLVKVRDPAGPFDFHGEDSAGFQATQPYWSETSTWVHLNDAGYGVVARMVAEALTRLPLQ